MGGKPGVPHRPHKTRSDKGKPNPKVSAYLRGKPGRNLDAIARMKEALAEKGLLSPRPAWRPSTYQTDFCEEVMEHCSNGASLTSFAAKIGVPPATLSEWGQKYPDFWQALQVAKAKAAAWHDEHGLKVVANGDRGGQSAMVKFYLSHHARNEFGEVPSQVTVNNNTLNASVISSAEPSRALEMFQQVLRGEPLPKTIEGSAESSDD